MRFVNVAFVTLDSATLLYTYISRFSVNPHYISRGRKSGKAAAINFIPNRFSTSCTNGPRLISRARSSTHSAFGERSHARAYTVKQGPSLPRPQDGLCRQRNCHRKNSRRKRMHASWCVSASSGTAAPPAVYLGGCSLNIRCISMTDCIDK